MRETLCQFLAGLSARWPSEWRITATGSDISDVTGHPLEHQVRELLVGRAASFPYPSANRDTVWFTMAPDAESLQSAIEDLRAWVLPTYGREGCIKTSAAVGEVLGAQILMLSPAGYFRWRTSGDEADRAVRQKLAQKARLDRVRPLHARTGVPSLFELRQRFEIALIAGDNESAGAAISTIDRHGLDTATNTQFMQVRLRDRFHDNAYVTDDPYVRALVALRMPHAIRVCLVRAFHAHYFEALELRGDLDEALRIYCDVVHPILGGALGRCSPMDGMSARKLLSYRAIFLNDRAEAASLLTGTDDPALSTLLANVAGRAKFSTVSTEATASLGQAPPPVATWSAEEIRRLIKSAPESLPASLRDAYDELVQLATSRAPSAVEKTEPRTWQAFIAALAKRQWMDAAAFLDQEHRPSAASLQFAALNSLLDALEESLTDPLLEQDSVAGQVPLSALVILIGDIRLDPRFPRSYHAASYLRLHQLWVQSRKGSTHREDISLFLVLADAALAEVGAEVAVIDGVQRWWTARRGEHLLPFLLESLSQVCYFSSTASTCVNLWLDAVGLINRGTVDLTRGEREAWRALGIRVGVDVTSVNELLVAATSEDNNDVDLLADVGWEKIAILSMREKQAQEAAQEIEQRTRAIVLVVSEKDAGIGAANAATADVILVVWAAISHALYRAFDSVRDKLVYVQGTGAESILLALERHAMKHAQT